MCRFSISTLSVSVGAFLTDVHQFVGLLKHFADRISLCILPSAIFAWHTRRQSRL